MHTNAAKQSKPTARAVQRPNGPVQIEKDGSGMERDLFRQIASVFLFSLQACPVSGVYL